MLFLSKQILCLYKNIQNNKLDTDNVKTIKMPLLEYKNPAALNIDKDVNSLFQLQVFFI